METFLIIPCQMIIMGNDESFSTPSTITLLLMIMVAMVISLNKNCYGYYVASSSLSVSFNGNSHYIMLTASLSHC